MKNNYIAQFLKVISWPILFWIGQFLLLILIGFAYCLFQNIDSFPQFINQNSYIVSFFNMIIFFPIFYRKYKKYQEKYQEKIRYPLKIVLFGIFISAFLNELILIIKILLKIEMTVNLNIFLLLNTVLIGPILEEILFRGIVFNQLLEFNSEKKSIFLTTLIFSLIHGNILSILYTFIVGYFLNIIYLRERTLKASILFHITINFVASFLIPLIYVLV